MLRKNEEQEILKTFRERLKLRLVYINASKLFLKKLRNVANPETKRKVIG